MSQLALIADYFMNNIFEQKAGDKHQLYIRKLRETPKAYSTAVIGKLMMQQAK
jgi:hypothetical protein